MNLNESEVGFEVKFEDSSAVKHKIPDNAAEIFCAIKINDGGMLAAVTEGGGDLDFIGKDQLRRSRRESFPELTITKVIGSFS